MHYHGYKTVTFTKDSSNWFHKKTVFSDGTTHYIIYNSNLDWISSVVEYPSGKIVENVEMMDKNGNLSIGKPKIVIDGNGIMRMTCLDY
jgi:hypothetical protein